MSTFEYSFTVRAPLAAVSAFHHDTRALRKLTPPPMWVQMHDVEPLGEGSRSEFTLWFGPLPVRWVAVHSNVSEQGFTDQQASGPMRQWVHTHRFTPEGDGLTRIGEHVAYEHHSGWRGLRSRLLFSRPALWLLFSYRKVVTRRAVQANHSSDYGSVLLIGQHFAHGEPRGPLSGGEAGDGGDHENERQPQPDAEG